MSPVCVACVTVTLGAGTEAALPLASGMAAICSTLLTLLNSGDHMLIQVGGMGQDGAGNATLLAKPTGAIHVHV